MRVLIVPDKFKGTLTAGRAAEAIARGWQRARRQDKVRLVPMSDGGDGFGEVMGRLLAAEPKKARTSDAAGRPCTARWWWHAKSGTAIIDSAAVIGLARLLPGRFHPFELDTFGLGKVVEAAFRQGARRCVVGVGGSATNDGGFGLARALRWTFLDAKGNSIKRWPDLASLVSVHTPLRKSPAGSVIVAVDVQNRLLGSRGCSRIYGPQKGLKPHQFAIAERALSRLAAVMKKFLGFDFSRLPGSGAAGGLGFGFAAFLGARLEPGFEIFSAEAGLKKMLTRTDLVITGEGRIDRSTCMGKGAGCVAALCGQMRIPCIGLAGTIEPGARRKARFTRNAALTDITTTEEAKACAGKWLETLSRVVATDWPIPGVPAAQRRQR